MEAWPRMCGPILEMVTEKKYLLRSAKEWQGRRKALGILDEILGRVAHR